jgi:hypothetical protein
MMTRRTAAALAPSGRLWTAQDVADYLTVPLATLCQRRYLDAGPTAYRVGGHLRYEPAAVQTWLEQQARPATGR